MAPGPRLPWIQRWLIEHVWTLSAYDALPHSDYLKQGEERVNRFEELLATSADRIYKELLSPPKPERSVLSELKENTAVVIFDGLSLREIPVIIMLAAKSGFNVREIDCAIGAVPSETVDFIER